MLLFFHCSLWCSSVFFQLGQLIFKSFRFLKFLFILNLLVGRVYVISIFVGYFGQSLASSLINFSTSVLYLSSLVLSALSATVIVAFSHIAPYNSSGFQERNMPLVFNLNYFFLVSSARSCLSRMVLSAVCTSNFFQAILLNVVLVLFTAFDTYLSSSTGFPVVSKFLAFEAPQRSWEVLLNSLKTIADLHLVGSLGLIKC